MSYQSYVLAAYLVFVAVLLWDFVSPRVRIAQTLRGLKALAARRARATQTSSGELQR